MRHKSLAFLQPATQPGSLGRLGHFEVLELLGKGGFGIVLKAFDDNLERQVAIKVLGPQLTGNANARSRFVREARAAAAVNNKYVVSTYEVYEQPIPYLVMEYVAGKSLQDRLDQLEPFAPRDILRLGAEIAQGLAAAHQQGLIHRDIKPANILQEERDEGRGARGEGKPAEGGGPGGGLSVLAPRPSPLAPHVKIADFGLARAVDDIGMTQSGMIAGTPLFMSPEQARGEPLDHRSDLFSLGSVLYALCTGHPPFKANKTLGVLKRVCEDTPRPIREINAAIPEALAGLIDRLLVKDPGGRIQTAAEVAELLKQQLAHLDDPAHAGGEITDQLPAESARLNAAVPPTKKVRRRTRLAVACVLLGVVSSLYLGVAQRDKGPSEQTNENEAKDVRGDKPGLEQPHQGPPDAEAERRQALEQKLAAEPGNAARASELADLLLDTTRWTVLKPSAMKSKGGATLTQLDDDSILAGGVQPQCDQYTIDYIVPERMEIRSIRLEALTDDSLPDRGPGRGRGWVTKGGAVRGAGVFGLMRWDLIAKGPGGADSQQTLRFHAAWADHSMNNVPLGLHGAWNISWAGGQDHTSVWALREPVTLEAGTELRSQMGFNNRPHPVWGDQHLGRFRLSVSSDPAAFDREPKRFTARKIIDPWARLAAAYAVNGRIEEAAQAFRKALQRAGGYEARKPIVEAAARFDGVLSALIQRQPDDPQLLLVLARQHAERGKQRLAEKQPAKAQAELEKARAIFTRLPSPPDKWTVLKPVEMKAATGATMELQKDGSVFVHQNQSFKNDTYTLVFQSELKGITGLRLEALADPRLPGGGPGWASNGNFCLNEMTLEATPAQDPDTARRIALRNPSADFNQTEGGGFHVRGAVDGNDSTGWAVHPEFNKDHTAVFDLAEAIGDGQAARLTVRLNQGDRGIDKVLLGRFRLSFTNDATTAQATRVRLDLKDSALVDLYVALGTAYAQQGQTTEAVAAFAEAVPLAADRVGKASIIAAAAPLPGVLEELAERAAGDGRFQADLARHYAERGNAPAAEAARTKARTLFEEKLAKEPENAALAADLAELLLISVAPWDWVVLKPAGTRTESGAKLTLDKDGSILVEAAPGTEPHRVRWQPGPQPVRAVRIETSTDKAPLFNEYQAIAAGMGPSRSGSWRGRFVRLDLSGDNRTINLAELQVFHGEQNIALGKKTRQSSSFDERRIGPERAVDGNTEGNDGNSSYAHTQFETDPWWEVDLGSEQPIDRIVIWNRGGRGEGTQYYTRMKHFRVRVLDRSRKVVFEQVVAKAPSPSTEIVAEALLDTNAEAAGDTQPLIVRLPRGSGKDALARYRVSVATHLADLGSPEEKRLAALKLTDGFAKLAAAYHVIGDQVARDKLEQQLKHHPAAAAGVGDVYAATQDWERASAEYGKAITHQPADVALLIKLAAAYQSTGRTREAVPHLANASAANPRDTLLSLKVAALQAWFGQEKELAATRKRMLALAQGTNNADLANTAAKICSLAPATDKRELEAALALGHTGAKLHRNEWTLLSPGMAEYRSGNYAAADEALIDAGNANPKNRHVPGTAAFYWAMSLFRQGKQDEARQLARAAAASMPPLPRDENNPLAGGANHDDLILWLAYKEAKALFMFDAKPPP